ncbi:MAG: ribose 5-phosphate isomerase B [Anaerolineae bacterium]|nr:ribose 5-phosphate isomerase B [Anaerolineae bacterium]
MLKIAFGSDHIGFGLKKEIMAYLTQKGYTCFDFGAHDENRTSYPIHARATCQAVVSGEYDLGILICGTGVGMSISANKIHGIRAVVCSEPYSAALSRQHNNTNVLAMGARVVGVELAKMIVDNWLAAQFEGGRHQERVEMITALENER